MVRLTYLVLFILFFEYCSPYQNQEIEIGNLIAKGEMKDSSFNGLIKFYNKSDDRLVKESYYQHGILNGMYKDFYEDGKVKTIGNYSYGKQNGLTYKYDSSTNLTSTSFTYYGIPVGQYISYSQGEIKKYSFYSLENEILFNINYDSINEKGILEIEDNFFFIHYNDLENSSKRVYKIYNIQPPKYHFDYSLVFVNDSLKVVESLEKLNTNDVWCSFEIDTKIQPESKYYAIQLFVTDSINKKNCTLIKVLKD